MNDTGPEPLTGPTVEVNDPLEGATANCPTCLEPLTPHLGAWWCNSCERDVQVET